MESVDVGAVGAGMERIDFRMVDAGREGVAAVIDGSRGDSAQG